MCSYGSKAALLHCAGSSTMDLPSSPCPLCFIYLFLICLPQIFPLTQQHILLRRFKNRWLKLRTLYKNVEPLRHMENVRNKSLFFTFCMDWELFCTDILILSTGNTLRIRHHQIYRQSVMNNSVSNLDWVISVA